MPIVVAEKWDSRETTLGEDSSVDLRFVIRGTDNDVDAHAALIADSPALYGGLVRQCFGPHHGISNCGPIFSGESSHSCCFAFCFNHPRWIELEGNNCGSRIFTSYLDSV